MHTAEHGEQPSACASRRVASELAEPKQTNHQQASQQLRRVEGSHPQWRATPDRRTATPGELQGRRGTGETWSAWQHRRPHGGMQHPAHLACADTDECHLASQLHSMLLKVCQLRPIHHAYLLSHGGIRVWLPSTSQAIQAFFPCQNVACLV